MRSSTPPTYTTLCSVSWLGGQTRPFAHVAVVGTCVIGALEFALTLLATNPAPRTAAEDPASTSVLRAQGGGHRRAARRAFAAAMSAARRASSCSIHSAHQGGRGGGQSKS